MMIGPIRNIRIVLSIEWPEGKFCILANGRCPRGFRRHEGHLKSLYLYSSHSQFMNSVNLEAVLLVAMVATVDSHSHWLSHFDHLLQIGLRRSYWITNEITRKLKDKKLPLTMCLIEQRLKVSGIAISCCEDHSFTKIYFRLKKRKDNVSSFGYDFTTSGKSCFGTHIPIETIFVWLNKIIKFLLLT